MKIHPKAVKGDKSQVGAPMPGTVLSEYKILQILSMTYLPSTKIVSSLVCSGLVPETYFNNHIYRI